jgi:CrcB protein
MTWMMVAAGGAIGALTRFEVFQLWRKLFPGLPVFWATFIVNMIGCFVIGYIFALTNVKVSSENFKSFWMVGILGGFTTFSAFGLDIFQMIQTKSFLFTATYFLFHGLVCITMVYLGCISYNHV